MGKEKTGSLISGFTAGPAKRRPNGTNVNSTMLPIDNAVVQANKSKAYIMEFVGIENDASRRTHIWRKKKCPKYAPYVKRPIK